ncbi:hypothetical protein BAS10_17800 [Elizabethkingia meningoseptica]|uniref:hypothetical protein n=1 Tax=Elizabethkingia meningoseptica TaxID=238 RepID=UPI00099949B4|nr:hypothetical protein [Elizabethkingia meningoseptica]OPC03170.1 hypothetical protein BAS10_17800 [Elizabethkingia meningoseptica]
MSEYKRSFEDEIDWKIIEQLHNATARFSSSSLEFKKIYFAIIGIATPIIFKLSGEKFDIALLISPLIISFFFWFLDSFTYYYQEKLREKMDNHFEILKKRNEKKDIVIKDANIISQKEEFTLENNRNSKGRLKRSIFNNSSAFYPILIILNIILIVCNYAGLF